MDGVLDNVQLALDGAGFIPEAQSVAGVLNAGINFYRGNWGSGLLNLATAIPIAGALAKGAMVASKVSSTTMAAILSIGSKSHSVYQAIEASTGTVKYVGRTFQVFQVRVAQHMAKRGLFWGKWPDNFIYIFLNTVQDKLSQVPEIGYWQQ